MLTSIGLLLFYFTFLGDYDIHRMEAKLLFFVKFFDKDACVKLKHRSRNHSEVIVNFRGIKLDENCICK